MKIELTDKYFGDMDALERFVRDTLEEINEIEEDGKKHSKEPERFLSDVYPRLQSIQILFENFLKRIDKEKSKIVFDGMGD